MSKKEILRIFNLFIFWILFLSFVVVVAPKFLPYQPSFPYAPQLNNYGLPGFISKLASFDGVHYLTIAKKGYEGTGLIQAFFPLYPLMTRGINLFFNNYLLSGLFLSHVFAFLSFLAFYYLVKMDFSKKVAWLSLLILAFFSTSFYLRSFYNESLFLFLIFSSFIAVKKKKYLLAGILGGLASATRVVGIAICPSLAIWVFFNDRKNILAYLKVTIPSLTGLLFYMIYLKTQFGDYLYFFHLQEQFGASRQSSLVIYPQVVYRYLRILATAPINWKFYAYLQEFVLSILALLVLAVASWQKFKKKIKIDWSYLAFAAICYFVPTLTGNFSSMPRYLLPCFVIFAVIAVFLEKQKPLIRISYLTISTIFLIINLILFSQGFWIA